VFLFEPEGSLLTKAEIDDMIDEPEGTLEYSSGNDEEEEMGEVKVEDNKEEMVPWNTYRTPKEEMVPSMSCDD